MYGNLFNKSWKDLKNNLSLIVIPILSYVAFFIILLIFALIFGSKLFLSLANMQNIDQQQLTSLIMNQLPTLILAIILFIIVIFFVGNIFSVWIFNYIKDIVNKKKTGFGISAKGIRKYYWRLILLDILLLLIILILGIIFAILGVIFSLIPVIGPIILIILVILILLYVILRLVFVYPALFLRDIGPVESIKDSFRFTKGRLGYSFVIFLIILVAVVILSLINYLLQLIPILGQIIYFILAIILSIWIYLLLFNAYKARLKG